MPADDQHKIVAGLYEQKRRLALALDEFRKGEKGVDISQILHADEFRDVRVAANLAVENKLQAMLRGAEAQLNTAANLY